MKKLNVVSVFDGMSCGQIALKELGFEVENYFASEVDKYAIKVANKNFPNMHNLGSIVGLDTSELPSIDLYIGGSPCQSFSRQGDGSGFDGSSKLFFEWVRVWKELKAKNPNMYFLLENVVMKKEWSDMISDILGVQPIKINSSLVSAQSRNRLYWTNIPNVQQPIDRGLVIEDVIEPIFSADYPSYLDGEYCGRKRKDMVKLSTEKGACLTASMYKGQISSYCKNDKGEVYKFTPQDCEILQTVPQGYTDCVSNTQRFKMLGNGWNIETVAHIFSYIPYESELGNGIN